MSTQTRLRAAVFMLLTGLTAACGTAGPPDYQDAAEIAAAMNASGIQCAFVDTTTGQPSTAVSSGRCDGEGVSLTMHVFQSAEERQEAVAYSERFVCDLGIENPTQVRGDRWLVGTSEPSLGPTTIDAEDLAAATGGELIPACRD